MAVIVLLLYTPAASRDNYYGQGNMGVSRKGVSPFFLIFFDEMSGIELITMDILLNVASNFWMTCLDCLDMKYANLLFIFPVITPSTGTCGVDLNLYLKLKYIIFPQPNQQPKTT